MSERPLGRREPADWRHVEKFPLRAFLATVPVTVEKVLPLPPGLRPKYDQGREGSCVGFACSWMSSINNTPRTGARDSVAYYDALWLYQRAQEGDEWDDTPPESGTSVRAGLEVLRTQGHRRLLRGKSLPPDPREGVEVYRWAETADQLRAGIAAGIAAVWGTPWFESFDTPEAVGKSAVKEHWIGRDFSRLGRLRGGHAICVHGASDKRQAFKLVNSWGTAYPPVWVPYDTFDRILQHWGGEAGLVTDR